MKLIKYFQKENSENPFLQFKVQPTEYIERDVAVYRRVKLRLRAIVFILDYSLFYMFIALTLEFIKIFTPELPNEIVYITYTFYAFVFIAIEYYFDGTIFKILFKMRSISTHLKKIGLHIFVIKFLLRPIAFLLSLIYFKFCFNILLWLFGIFKPLFKFLNGEMETVWYDSYIKQIVIHIPEQND